MKLCMNQPMMTALTLSCAAVSLIYPALASWASFSSYKTPSWFPLVFIVLLRGLS